MVMWLLHCYVDCRYRWINGQKTFEPHKIKLPKKIPPSLAMGGKIIETRVETRCGHITFCMISL